METPEETWWVTWEEVPRIPPEDEDAVAEILAEALVEDLNAKPLKDDAGGQ